ncbi:34478_t:CDS:2, partial [Racocetra persica]
ELHDDVREVKAELRWQQSEQSNELSSQVLDDMYTNVVKCLFSQDVYPPKALLRNPLRIIWRK